MMMRKMKDEDEAFVLQSLGSSRGGHRTAEGGFGGQN